MCHIHIKKIQIAFSLITKNKWYCKHVNDYCIVNSLWYWPLFPWFNVLWNCKTFTYELAYKHKLISIQQRNLERYTCVKVVLLIVLRTQWLRSQRHVLYMASWYYTHFYASCLLPSVLAPVFPAAHSLYMLWDYLPSMEHYKLLFDHIQMSRVIRANRVFQWQ